jgi:hypothetical protein
VTVSWQLWHFWQLYDSFDSIMTCFDSCLTVWQVATRSVYILGGFLREKHHFFPPFIFPFFSLPLWLSLLLGLCPYYALTMALSPLFWDFALLFSDSVQLCWTLSNFVGLCPTLLDFVQLCWTLSNFVGLCSTLLNFVQLCWPLFNFVKLFVQLLLDFCLTLLDFV